MPRRIASSSTPRARAASAAPSAFARLKRPRSLQVDARRGRRRRRRTSIASGSSAASRRPHSSPTLTTARSACVEERALRGEVLLHRAVEVEVVLRQVREDEHREPRAVEPALRLGDRRRLHRARAVAGVDHLAKQPLQVDRLRRVQARRRPLAARPGARCSSAAPAAARPLEDRVQEERGRRLAVRAGDGGDRRARGTGRRRRAPRPAASRRARSGRRAAATGDVERPLDDERGGAGGGRVAGEVVPVAPSRRARRRRASRAAPRACRTRGRRCRPWPRSHPPCRPRRRARAPP